MEGYRHRTLLVSIMIIMIFIVYVTNLVSFIVAHITMKKTDQYYIIKDVHIHTNTSSYLSSY